MKRWKLKAASAALLAGYVAACGTAHPSAGPPPVQAVASQLGATGVHLVKPTLYASAEGTASWHSQQVDIATFDTAKKRDDWIKIASQYVTVVKKGPLWVMTE